MEKIDAIDYESNKKITNDITRIIEYKIKELFSIDDVKDYCEFV